eukprot:12947-Pelagococcus_subviridis.AAC.3
MFSAMRARTPRVRRGVNGGDASATRVTKRFPRNARVARRAKSASRDFVRGARVARAHRKTISNRRGWTSRASSRTFASTASRRVMASGSTSIASRGAREVNASARQLSGVRKKMNGRSVATLNFF